MTGTKPDERIRTPMQWTRAAHGGFTTGTPWESLQPDSLAVTVAAQDRDASSLLAWHRRMIHLRATNRALGSGILVPLTTSDSAVTAYARRDGDRAVVVIVNLGASPVRGLTFSAPAGALPAGRWRAVSLLGGGNGATVRAASDGALAGWIPLGVLAGTTGYMFELQR
jgi:glycosidase